MKLACPEKDVVALTGDGTYIYLLPDRRLLDGAEIQRAVLDGDLHNQGWNARR
jgi:hypothetical protein